MLVWHNTEIRSNAFGESYFSPNEMQDLKSARYHLILDYLNKLSDKFAELFERAWYSEELNTFNLGRIALHQQFLSSYNWELLS